MVALALGVVSAWPAYLGCDRDIVTDTVIMGNVTVASDLSLALTDVLSMMPSLGLRCVRSDRRNALTHP